MRLPFDGWKRNRSRLSPPAGGATRKSRALAAAIETLQSRPERRVLDLGSASGENVQFFSQVECQLEILDLYPQLVERPDRLARTHEAFAIGQLISQILTERPGKKETDPVFDLVLSWDLFDFLSPEQIRGLVQGLEPYVKSGTRLLSQVSYLGTLPEQPRLVKIHDRETIAVQLIPGHKPSPRYTEPQLLKVMPGWEVDRCFLQRDGFREYLFVRL